MRDELPAPSLRPYRRGDWVPSFVGLAVAAAGLVNLISALTPELPGRLRATDEALPHELVLAAHGLALPAGLALLLMGYYLRRRRQRAARVALALLLAAGALNILKGLDVEEAFASWAAAGLVWWARDAFCAVHVDGRLRTALLRIAGIWAGTLATATLAVLAAAHWITPSPDPRQALTDAARIVGLVGPVLPVTGPVAWLNWALAGLGASALVGSAWVLFRPFRDPVHLPSAQARSAAAQLVRSHGIDTLSFFKLRDDLEHLHSADGRALLAYKVQNGVLLVAGNPVGPQDAVPQLLREVCALAEIRGLRLGVVGACAGMAELWAQAGLKSFYLGDEAVVDTPTFVIDKKRRKKVRQAVNRVERAGYTIALHRGGDLDEATVAALEGVSARWRAGAPERGFSMAMNSIGGEHLQESVVVVARDVAGVVRGFLHFVPTYGRSAVSLSFMRRDKVDVPNGLNDALVVRSIELLRDECDIAEVSLNFAAFARLMHSPDGLWERLLGRVAKVLNPFFQIESLYRFNAKFSPRWVPRYLCYEGSLLGWTQTSLAAAWAEGQIPKPAWPTRTAD
ncbi:MAG: hypothetical protein JWO02_889 [Solirubrobacterales bacterium]|nr:hypothetical protein [Solirubrobacterales bacterium]